MAKKLTTDTFISLGNENKPERTEASKGNKQNFSLDINSPNINQNTLVTPWGGKEMIKELFASVWNDPAHDEDILAVEFDRQTLMLILSQNGCEGIRFSFCKFNNKTTLVAFGVEQSGKLIGEEMFKEDYNSKTPLLDPPPGSEQGHGITIKEFKTKIENKAANKSITEITDQFFGLSSLK